MIPLVEGDFISEEESIKLFPKDALDEFGQQIDLREDNSWVTPIEEASTSMRCICILTLIRFLSPSWSKISSLTRARRSFWSRKCIRCSTRRQG